MILKQYDYQSTKFIFFKSPENEDLLVLAEEDDVPVFDLGSLHEEADEGIPIDKLVEPLGIEDAPVDRVSLEKKLTDLSTEAGNELDVDNLVANLKIEEEAVELTEEIQSVSKKATPAILRVFEEINFHPVDWIKKHPVKRTALLLTLVAALTTLWYFGGALPAGISGLPEIAKMVLTEAQQRALGLNETTLGEIPVIFPSF
jgi:hypothetical protein